MRYSDIILQINHDSTGFGTHLKEARQNLNLTQSEVAEKALCSTDTVRRYEQGYVKKLDVALDLAIAVGLLRDNGDNDEHAADDVVVIKKAKLDELERLVRALRA